jgi:hypothetical protein
VFAKIYRPTRTAMQAGRRLTKQWVLEFEPAMAKTIEPLMGWTSQTDTRQQIKLHFDTRDEAIAYAKRCGIPHQVVEPKEPRRNIKAYADNFAFDRKKPWSH